GQSVKYRTVQKAGPWAGTPRHEREAKSGVEERVESRADPVEGVIEAAKPLDPLLPISERCVVMVQELAGCLCCLLRRRAREEATHAEQRPDVRDGARYVLGEQP